MRQQRLKQSSQSSAPGWLGIKRRGRKERERAGESRQKTRWLSRQEEPALPARLAWLFSPAQGSSPSPRRASNMPPSPKSPESAARAPGCGERARRRSKPDGGDHRHSSRTPRGQDHDPAPSRGFCWFEELWLRWVTPEARPGDARCRPDPLHEDEPRSSSPRHGSLAEGRGSQLCCLRPPPPPRFSS